MEESRVSLSPMPVAMMTLSSLITFRLCLRCSRAHEMRLLVFVNGVMLREPHHG